MPKKKLRVESVPKNFSVGSVPKKKDRLLGANPGNQSPNLHSRTPVAAAEPSAPNKAVSTATTTFAIVFHFFIIAYLLSLF